MKTIPHPVAAAISLDDFVNALFASGLDPDHGARVKIESPCGCVATLAIHLEAGDTTGCVNRELDPTEVN